MNSQWELKIDQTEYFEKIFSLFIMCWMCVWLTWSYVEVNQTWVQTFIFPDIGLDKTPTA